MGPPGFPGARGPPGLAGNPGLPGAKGAQVRTPDDDCLECTFENSCRVLQGKGVLKVRLV